MHPNHPARRARTAAGRRVRPAALAAAAVVLALAASGCSLLPFASDDGPSTESLADGSRFLVAAPTNYYQQAIVAGRLALIGGDCVGLETPESGESAALALPHGTRPSEDGAAIVLPDGLQIALGDPVIGGGGYTTLSQVPDAFAAWPDAPSGCAGATYLASIYDVSIGERP